MMLLGLDVGKKRIGVAKTDELALMAHSVGLIHRTSDKQAIVEILKLVIEWEVKKVVMGLPKDMKGHIGKAAEGVMAFGTKLQAELQTVELVYWDERLSTRGSERMLIEEADVSRAKRRQVIDKLAAQEILQNYLDAHRNRFPAC